MKATIQTLQRLLSLAVLLPGLIVMGAPFTQSAQAEVGGIQAPAIEFWTPAVPQTYQVIGGNAYITNTVKAQSPLEVASARYELYHPDFGWAYSFPASVQLFNPYEGTLVAYKFPTWTNQKIRFMVRPSGGALTTGPEHIVNANYARFFPFLTVPAGFMPLEPDDNPCIATPATPGANYVARPDDMYDFFRLVVPVVSRVTLTISNFTVNGQLQFRSPLVNGNCSPVDSTNRIDPFWGSAPPSVTGGTLNYYNVSPGTYYARVSTAGFTTGVPYTFNWRYTPGAGSPLEPNNNSCAAIGVSLGPTYSAYPEDMEDWYYFDISAASNIQVTINNYSASGQFGLYKQGANCGSVSSLVLQNSTSGQAILTANNQPAGRYFLRVVTLSGANTNTQYSFRVTTGQAWNANINTCSPMPANGDNCIANQSGGKFTVFWQDAPGATLVRATLNNMSAVGGCPAGTSAQAWQFAPATTPNGSQTVGGSIAKGYYSLNLEIWGPGNLYRGRLNMPIKMDCDFLSNSLNGLPEAETPIGPQLVDTPPDADAAPSPTAIPLPTDLPEAQPTPMP